MKYRIKQIQKSHVILHINMDTNLCISVILDVFARYHPYSLAVLSSVKFKIKDLTTVLNTVPLMCFRLTFLSKKV